jgi:hypothetical protein
LPQNWTLIGISGNITNMTAQSLIDQGIDKVMRRGANGVYYSYIYEDEVYYGTDFRLNNYTGYWVWSHHGTTLHITVTQYRFDTRLNLTAGYNLLAVPKRVDTSFILTNNPHILNIVVKRHGIVYSYNRYSLETEAFTLEPKEGVYIYSDTKTQWVIL